MLQFQTREERWRTRWNDETDAWGFKIKFDNLKIFEYIAINYELFSKPYRNKDRVPGSEC
jgi:hypothetical protein